MRQNEAMRRMASRLGYNLGTERQFTVDPSDTLDGLQHQVTVMKANGGFNQQERMIFDKRRSFDRALNFSYQAANIRRVQCTDYIDNSFRPNIREIKPHDICRALISPDKTKMNYDDKIISVHFEENYHSGDVFEWMGTNTYWMIYLQDITEIAYFRGEIRRCDYEIAWEDEDGSHSTYAAVRGPVETKIDYIQKHGISVDNPNHSLNILLPRNEETLKYFRRYSKFYLQDVDEGAPQVCWRVEATDWISTPGILEITAVEYYANESEDDIENGIVGALIVKPPKDPNSKEINATIEGDTFIKPKITYTYEFTGEESDSWSIKEKCPVTLVVDPDNPLQVSIRWDITYRGQFTLCYGSYEKIIVVESLF